MVSLTLCREIYSPDFTAGILIRQGVRIAYTLEPTIRRPGEKVDGKTAIPARGYRVIVDKSIRFGRMMPRLLAVPGFEGIRIHGGNTAKDSTGCILVAAHRITDGRIWLSREKAITALLTAEGDGAYIEIVNALKDSAPEWLRGVR